MVRTEPDHTPTTGTAFAGGPTRDGRAGAGNRAGPRPERPLVAFVVLAALVLAAAVAVLLVAGCTADDRAGASANLTKFRGQLQAAGTSLAGSATTQPSPVVVGVEAAVPGVAPYLTLAGWAMTAAAGATGVLIGVLKGGSASQDTIATLTDNVAVAAQAISDHKVALAEVAGDIKQYRQPTVPWSHTTAKLVADVAGMSAAAVESATHITDLTIHPDPDPAATAAAAVRQAG